MAIAAARSLLAVADAQEPPLRGPYMQYAV
jgi:hypothetical protein